MESEQQYERVDWQEFSCIRQRMADDWQTSETPQRIIASATYWQKIGSTGHSGLYWDDGKSVSQRNEKGVKRTLRWP
jgi:hypothetical protein